MLADTQELVRLVVGSAEVRARTSTVRHAADPYDRNLVAGARAAANRRRSADVVIVEELDRKD